MPRLRSLPKGTPIYAPAPAEDIARARELRAQGENLQAISLILGYSIDWVWRHTKGVAKSPIRYRYRMAYRDFPKFPHDNPELARRVRNLARRGFDVPPSKQADWEELGKVGYTVEERRVALKLE